MTESRVRPAFLHSPPALARVATNAAIDRIRIACSADTVVPKLLSKGQI
jgi:hypothetical protein